MFLGGWLLGISTFDYAISSPQTRSYSKIKLYGGSTDFDRLHIYNTVKVASFISAIDPNISQAWTPDTILLAEFNHSLDGGNVINLPAALTGFQIYRKEAGSSTSTLLTTVPNGTLQYVDYTTQAYKTYSYEIVPITDTEIGSPLIPDTIYTDYFGWYLMDYDTPSTVYKFDLNIKSGTISNETDVTTYQNYTQKPSVAQGERNYIKGEISFMAGEISAVDGTLQQTSDYLTDLRTFINNQKPKLFKSRKGDVWKILTYGLNVSYTDEIEQQPAMVSFTFCEII